MTARESSQRANGAYRLLAHPRTYASIQALLGGRRALRRFVTTFVRPFAGARVLDVGCGTGALLEHLPPDVDYIGYDVNAAYIESARRRYGGRGAFFCARVGEEPPEISSSEFDLVVAVALLHHLTDAEAAEVARSAARLLSTTGVFVSIDPTLHDGQNVLARLFARLDRGRAVRSPEKYRLLLAPHFTEIEGHLLTDMLTIPYSHFVMRATNQGDATAGGAILAPGAGYQSA